MLHFSRHFPFRGQLALTLQLHYGVVGLKLAFYYLPYLSFIYEKAMYRYVLDGKSALAWELPFPGRLSSM